MAPGVLPCGRDDEALRLTVLTGYLLNCENPAASPKFDRNKFFLSQTRGTN